MEEPGNKRTLKLWRETVVRKFRNRPLPTVIEVFDCNVEYGPIVDFNAGDTTQFLGKWSQLILRFRGRQTRL
jgi:hypothetical protein